MGGDGFPEGYGAAGGHSMAWPAGGDDCWRATEWHVGSDKERLRIIGSKEDAAAVAVLMAQRDEAAAEVSKLRRELSLERSRTLNGDAMEKVARDRGVIAARVASGLRHELRQLKGEPDPFAMMFTAGKTDKGQKTENDDAE